MARLALAEKHSEESHTNCDIIEVWRKLVYSGLKIKIRVIENIDFENDYSAYETEKYNCVWMDGGLEYCE